MPRKERFHVDKRSKQCLRRYEEVHRKTPHSRGTKSWRKHDRILSNLKGVRNCSPNGRKRERPKAYILLMDDPNITMEEYIQLEAEKAHRRGQTFNWEIATYGKVRYFKDIDYFKDFKTEFPTIVYKDALTSKPDVSLEPTVSPNNVKDFDFEISFAESDDEDYTFTYYKNSFSYKLISINNLKPDSGDGNDKINVELSSKNIHIKPLDNVIDANIDTHSHEFDENFETSLPNMTQLPPRDQRHQWLRYEGQEYTDDIIQDFKERLGRIFIRQVVFASRAWRKLFEIRGPLVRKLILEFFSTCRIAQGVLDLDTLYILQFQLGAVEEALSLFDCVHYYWERHVEGRKQRAKMSGGHFIACLAKHFGLLIEEILQERQQVVAAGAAHADQEIPEEGVQTVDTTYPTSMDMAYRLSGRFPVDVVAKLH
ncbi:hypothetical protein Tco_0961465 [Tanacetum coccineum]